MAGDDTSVRIDATTHARLRKMAFKRNITIKKVIASLVLTAIEK